MVEGFRKILDEKNCKSADLIFPILTAFLDRYTGWVGKVSLTKVYVLYSKLMISMAKHDKKKVQNGHELKKLQMKVNRFKILLVETFSKHCTSDLFTLKFRLRDHAVEDLHVFNTLSVFYAASFERYDGDFKQAYKQRSQRRVTCMKETVSRVIRQQDMSKPASKTHISEPTNEA